MTDIKWDEPEPIRYERHPEFWAALRKKPGKWAVYPGPSKNTTQINRRKPEGGLYEATVRHGVMYVRWLTH